MSEELEAEQLITEITVRYGKWQTIIRRSTLDGDEWYWQKHGIADKIYFGGSDAAVHAALAFIKAQHQATELRERANQIEGEASTSILRISSASLDDEKPG